MMVFFFTQLDHSDYFKELLSEKHISYEFEIDLESGKYYFGIEKRFSSVVRKLNFLVFARYRNPFIENRFFKYLLISLTGIFIILALIGFWIS